MTKFELLRALARANIRLSLAGDKLLVAGNLRVIDALRGPLQAHKPALQTLIVQGRLDAALRDAAAYEAMLAEDWTDPRWIDVDDLLALTERQRLPVRVIRSLRGGRR